MGTITLRNLTKSYGRGQPLAVRGVDLAIADGEFMVLLGPSGCGKSTTLRMIAGLESITDGELLINDRVVNGVPAKDRDIAMVFQSYALYPHMTVYENMAFSLRRQRVGRAQIDRRVRDAAASLGLQELLQRKPYALSGGQRQRVALGRAIVRDPQVFLFDEPLSNLDAALRHATRNELIALHQRLGVTMVYVTHDQIEAMSMGSRIAIMNNGELIQVGRPMDVYRNPADTFVARFLGSPPMNLLAAAMGAQALQVGGSRVRLSHADAAALAGCRRLLLGIRPEDVYEEKPAGQRHLLPIETDVISTEALGAESLVSFRSAADDFLIARVPRVAHSAPGQRAVVWIDLAETTLFDADTKGAVLYRLAPTDLETSHVCQA